MEGSFFRLFLGLIILMFQCKPVAGSRITSELSMNNYDAKTVSTCPSLGFDYFDSTLFNCANCPTNQTASTSVMDGSGNSAGCECQSGFRKVANTLCETQQIDSATCLDYTCVSCRDLNEASSADGSICLPCGTNTTGIQTDGDCGCSGTNMVLIEKDILGNYLSSKYCAICPSGSLVVNRDGLIAGKYYYADRYSCQSCPDPLMTMLFVNNAYSCRCPTGYTVVGVNGIGPQSCISTSLAQPYLQQAGTSNLVYYSNQEISSLTLEHYFVLAATRCQYYWSIESFQYCQLLANLCVLLLYKRDSPACAAHINLLSPQTRSLTTSNVTNWVRGMPWIYYDSTVSGLTVCQQDIFSDSASLRQDLLQYVVASYYLNGTFRNFQSLDTLLTFCTRSVPYTDRGGGESASTTWQYYGYNFEVTYQCDLRSLLNTVDTTVDTQLFYELFLFDTATAKFAPIPVRLVQYLPTDNQGGAANQFYTKYFCDSPDKLVRRFFLFDVVSGRNAIDGDPAMIRVASRLYLNTHRILKTQSSIYPSVLTIDYTEYRPADWPIDTENYVGQSNAVSDYTVTVAYTIGLSLFQNTFFIFAVLLLILAFGFFLLRYYNWNKRNSRVITSAQLTSDLGAVNFENIMNIGLLLMNTYVLVFFPITVLIAWYFFVFYKLQSVPSILLPPIMDAFAETSPYFIFIVQLHVLALFQLTFVLYRLVYQQSRHPLYLIDWEPLKQKHLPSTSAAGGGTRGGVGGLEGGGNNSNTYQISIWRTVLVANKLLDLQIARKSNIIWTLFWIGFFLLGLDLENNGANQPSLDELSNPNQQYPINMVLRFANTTFFWLALSIFQYLWNYLIYEAFFSEPIWQKFIDFCTILKISVWVMDEKYHGYYLHCHSSIQYADINMLEVINMLSREENGLLMDRALENAPVDLQSFELFLSGEWYEEYMKLYQQLLQVQSITDILEYRRQQDSIIQQRAFGRPANSNHSNYPNNNSNTNSIWQINARYNRLNSGNNLSRKQGMPKGLKLGSFYYSHVPNEKLYGAWEQIIHFLKEFIDNNYQKQYLRYNIKERNYYEYMTNDAPDLSIPNQPSILVTDTRQDSYTKCFFYGNEIDLIIFEILMFSIYEVWFNNTMVSILLTYLTHWGIAYWRYHAGKVTLSKHGLIDSRFLFP